MNARIGYAILSSPAPQVKQSMLNFMSRNSISRSIILVAAILISGCSSPLGPDELRDLAAAERRWVTYGYTNYSYETRILCFCPPELNEWVVVQVQGATITSMKSLSGGDVPRSSWNERLTIEQLFRRISSYRPEWVHDVEAQYDSLLGYPTIVSLAGKPGVVDIGMSYHVRNVKPLE